MNIVIEALEGSRIFILGVGGEDGEREIEKIDKALRRVRCVEELEECETIEDMIEVLHINSSVEKIRGKERNMECVRDRRRIAVYMKSRGKGVVEIGKMIGRTHGAVINLISWRV